MKEEVVLLCSGEYPNESAGSKRVQLYKKGLSIADCDMKVVSTFKKANSKLGFYLVLFLEPFIVLASLFKHSMRAKVIFIYGFSWPTLLLIRVWTFLFRKKMVLEINEKPGSYYTSKLFTDTFVSSIQTFLLTRLVYPLCNGFVVISKGLEVFLGDIVQDEKRILNVPILIDTILPKYEEQIIPLQKPFIIHSGALSERKDGIVGVFRALAEVNRLSNKKLHLYLTDDKTDLETKRKIDEIIEENFLTDYVHFLGFLSEPTLYYYQKECEMLVLNKPDNEQNRYNFATKLGEYLRLSKPVIFTPVGEMCNYLVDNENGFEVPFNDSVRLAEKIVFVLEKNDLVKTVSENGRLLAEAEFNYVKHGQRLADFFDHLVND